MNWILVEKSLPPFGERVLLHAALGPALVPTVIIGKFLIDDSKPEWVTDEEAYLLPENVKAWQHLPDLSISAKPEEPDSRKDLLEYLLKSREEQAKTMEIALQNTENIINALSAVAPLLGKLEINP
jgi:hypothetical protein